MKDRRYPDQEYKINVWAPSGKIDFYVHDAYGGARIKLSEREAEELIDRLRFALMQAREERDD